MRRTLLTVFSVVATATLLAFPSLAAEGTAAAIARLADAPVYANVEKGDRESSLSKILRAKLDADNRQSTADWKSIKSREDWEKFARDKVAKLAASLGEPIKEPSPQELQVVVAKRVPGEGYTVEAVAFESRPHNWVSANVYLPEPARNSMPAIVICPSHHNSKTQGELQDMGMTWARAGAMVIVPDLVGYGDRREYPFTKETDYAGSFRLGRQAYYFRYNQGIQLHLAGESLMGWNVWDLRRALDVLLARKGADKTRTAILGSVAGGGDPCAVAGAVDPRFTVVAPFNFGGPQPETRFPLPENIEDHFLYSGSGSWESTRNLKLSCRDGFLPWVIVGSVAPRKLIYSHEFNWDKERDPVWARLQTVYGDFYKDPGSLDYTHGYGELKLRPPQASHCNNIGPPHRVRIHQALARWWKLPTSAETEFSNRLTSEDLSVFDASLTSRLKPVRVYDLAGQIAAERSAAFRDQVSKLSADKRAEATAAAWQKALGDVEPSKLTPDSAVNAVKSDAIKLWTAGVETEDGAALPIVTIVPPGKKSGPVVICVAQQGKARFLKERAKEIAALVDAGCAVTLVDLRGTGEFSPGSSVGRGSWLTSLASTAMMLGDPLLGQRVSDLRSVIRLVKSAPAGGAYQATDIVLWGDSFAKVNADDADLKIPLDAVDDDKISTPLGSMAVLMAALFEPDVKAVYARGGLVNFQSVYGTPFVYFPHDAVVPGAALAGDLDAVAAAIQARGQKLAVVDCVNGLNRRVSQQEIDRVYPDRAHKAQESDVVAWVKAALAMPK